MNINWKKRLRQVWWVFALGWWIYVLVCIVLDLSDGRSFRNERPDSLTEFKIYRDGEEYGPYDLGDVNEMLAEGSLLPTDLVWHNSMNTWEQFRRVAAHFNKKYVAAIEAEATGQFGFQWDLFLRAMAIWILSPFVVAGLWKLCVWFRRIQKIEPTEDTK